MNLESWCQVKLDRRSFWVCEYLWLWRGKRNWGWTVAQNAKGRQGVEASMEWSSEKVLFALLLSKDKLIQEGSRWAVVSCVFYLENQGSHPMGAEENAVGKIKCLLLWYYSLFGSSTHWNLANVHQGFVQCIRNLRLHFNYNSKIK